MTMRFTDALQCVETSAGWRHAPADAQGVSTHELDDGLCLRLSCPDGRRFIASCALGTFPDGADADSAASRERIGLLCAAAIRAEPSVLSVREGRLELHRVVDLDEAEPAGLADAVAGLLNDAARWRARLSEGGLRPASSSPFSMGSFGSAAWFPGDIAV